MGITPEARRARARLAAHTRWHPGDDLDELTEECLREIAHSRADEAISSLTVLVGKMSPGQLARLRSLATGEVAGWPMPPPEVRAWLRDMLDMTADAVPS